MSFIPLKVNKEQDVAFGRGFNESNPEGSILQNFKRWIQATMVASPISKSTGGAGWYVVDDSQESDESAPFIVVSNHDADNLRSEPNRHDEPHKIFSIGYIVSDPGKIRVNGFIWWDVDSHVGYGGYVTKELPTLDDSLFIYDFRGGPRFISIMTKTPNWEFINIGDIGADNELLPSPNLVAPIQNSVASGSNVELLFNAGYETNYTVGDYYFLSNFNQTEAIDYSKVLEINTTNHTVTVDILRNSFSIGSIFGPYPYRYFLYYSYNSYTPQMIIPIGSNRSSQYSNIIYRLNNNQAKAYTWVNDEAMDRLNPDAKGNYHSEYLEVGEDQLIDTLKEGLGPSVPILALNKTGLTEMSSGRVINGYNHIYFNLSSNDVGLFIPDYNNII